MATYPTGSQTDAPSPWTEDTLLTEDWDDLVPGRPNEDDEVVHEEGYWATPDSEQIYWQCWHDPACEARGTVGLMHGYGEHSARYGHVAVALVRSGYNVMAIDARGHGRSTGRRGFVRRFSRYADDLSMLKRRALDRWPDAPLFMLGHSNGGLTTLRYALRKPEGVQGFIVTSPLCRVAVEVSPVKSALGRLTSRMVPTLSLPSDLDANDLSHLEGVVDAYRKDPLVFDIANARWFTEMENAFDDLEARADSLDQPFFFLVAGDDRIVDPGPTESLFHRLASLDRELEVFPDLYHEILNERPWRTILQRIILWMERHRLDDTAQ